MPAPEAALDELRSALGADRVLTGADERRLHGTDESWHPPAPPDAVVRPRSIEEVVAVVSACGRHAVPVVPFGAGTSLEGHVAALRGGVCIDMAEMNGILRLSLSDLDVTVQAGVTREQLEARLRPEGVFFPVDPGADATIGGMVATGASGTTTVRYGGMRDNVISLVVVTAGGRVVRTRSRARKSSAGYDLTRLLVGSEGTLGVIVEATLRVHPTPEATSAAVIAFPELHAAVDCVVDVLAALVPVARIELLDALQVEGTNRLLGLDHVVAPTLFLELHGTAEEVERELGEVRAIAQDHGAARIEVAADETARRRLWRARHQAYPAARALRPGTRGYVTDVCVPVSALAACITEARAHLDDLGVIAPMVGHVGDGNFHVVMLIDPDDPDELRRAREFSDRLARRAIELDGTCTGEHGVGYGKTRYLEAEHGADGVALMRAIKGALDPDCLLNPGKVLP